MRITSLKRLLAVGFMLNTSMFLTPSAQAVGCNLVLSSPHAVAVPYGCNVVLPDNVPNREVFVELTVANPGGGEVGDLTLSFLGFGRHIVLNLGSALPITISLGSYPAAYPGEYVSALIQNVVTKQFPWGEDYWVTNYSACSACVGFIQTCSPPVTADQLLAYTKAHSPPSCAQQDSAEFQIRQNLQDLIDISLQNDWDPRFILAIAGAETTFGRSGFQEALTHHNFWGVGCEANCGACCDQYNWFKDAVEHVAGKLKLGPYSGKTTLAQLGQTWVCGDPPAPNCLSAHYYDHINPTTGELEKGWESTVRGVMAALGYPAGPNDEVTCMAGSSHVLTGTSFAPRVCSPATVYVTDPLGRSYGMACGSQVAQSEIPDVEEYTEGEDLKGMWIPNAIDGTYSLVLCGTGNGSYDLNLIISDETGVAYESTLTGQITTGETQHYAIAISKDDTSGNTITTVLSPPTCASGGPYVAECGGPLTSVKLDGSSSADPNGSQLSFLWASDCPTVTFDDATSPTPTIIIDSSTTPINCRVSLTVMNSFGLSSTCSSTVNILDTTPPTIVCSLDQTVITASSTGTVVNYPAAVASDNCSAIVSYSQGSGSVFPLGSTTVVSTVTDQANNQATCSFQVSVIYSWSDVLQPVNSDGSSVFKLGSTIPIRFQLTGASAAISDAVAKLSFTRLGNSIPGPINEAVSTTAANSGNLFRYTSGQYIFNWNTKGLTAGIYQLQIDLGDAVLHPVTLGLR